MDVRRYKDVIAVKTASEKVWGFHARNLDVFEMTQEMWSALENSSTLRAAPALLQEINNVESETSNEVHDATLTPAALASTLLLEELSLNVAQVCNLQCTYCAAGGDGTYGSKVAKVDLDKARQQIAFFLNAHIKASASPTEIFKDNLSGKNTTLRTFNIRFLGGEPLLYPQVIRQLCQYALLVAAGQPVQVTFSTTTNGTLITREVADLLAEFNFSVTISLDGNAKTNNESRPLKKARYSADGSAIATSTDMTLKGLQELRRVRSKLRAINVNSVFGAHNMAILETYTFLKEILPDWDDMNFVYSNNENLNENYSEQSGEALNDSYIEQMRQVAALAYKVGGLAELGRIRQLANPLSRVVSKTRHHSHCGAGKSLLQSDTKGDLYTCNWFMNDEEEKMGSLTTLSAERLKPYQATLIESNHCDTCWARYLCGGGCMAVHKNHSGDRHSKDPKYCKRTRHIAADMISYYADFMQGSLA